MSAVFQTLIVAVSATTALVLMIPLVAIFLYHRRKVEEIRARQRTAIAEETRAAIAALRREVEALRDTTTQYDLSFDTALHRLDSSVANLEQRLRRVEAQAQAAPVGRGVGG